MTGERAMAAALAGSACLHLALLVAPAGAPRPGCAVAAPPPAPPALRVALRTARPRREASPSPHPTRSARREPARPRAAPEPTPVPPSTVRRGAAERRNRSAVPRALPAAPGPPRETGGRSAAIRARAPARAPVPHAARAAAATAQGGAAAAPHAATPGPRLEAALRLRLAEYFRYPPLARRRGWEGTVRLGLRIEPDGRLTRVRVLAGSGYTVLDRAAARALERVGRVPEAAGWLGGRPFDMVLPVEYRLVSR